jgi:hypothetical protein
MDDNWVESYWSFMARQDFEEAIPLKEQHFPRSLFKYRPPNDYTIQMVKECYLWLADIETLNDPFEGLIQFDNDECLRAYYAASESQIQFTMLTGHRMTKEEVHILSTAAKPFKEYIRICKERGIPLGLTEEEHLAKVQKRWSEIIREQNRNIRICSFSKTNTSTLMWSHYADDHKGICIEYDFLFEDSIRPFVQPVFYRKDLHKIGLFEEYDTMQMIAANLIKSPSWSYEKEWRLTIFKQREHFFQKLSSPKPTAIYLGARINEPGTDFEQQIIAIAQVQKIPMFQMQRNPRSFNLDFRPIRLSRNI